MNIVVINKTFNQVAVIQNAKAVPFVGARVGSFNVNPYSMVVKTMFFPQRNDWVALVPSKYKNIEVEALIFCE
jgi:hypothetical protein